MARRRRKLRVRNPLLAIPPEGIHGLDVAGGRFFERAVGRPVTREDYYGVHTTGNQAIAMIYAMGAVQKVGGFPVILSLNVNGLEALPDVDAIAQAADLLGDSSLRSSYEGMDLDEACDAGYGEGPMIRPGDDVASAFMGVFEQNRFCSAFDDEDEWKRWLETGEYSAETATNVVDQRRYMHDFGLDRLIEVFAAKPWWPYIVDEPYDDEGGRRLEVIEDSGYKTISYEDLYNDHLMVESQGVATGRGSKAGYPQYHGTSSVLVQKAFPSLGDLDNPFHTDYSVEETEELLDLQGLSGNPRRARKRLKKKPKGTKRVTGVRGLVARALK